MKILYYLFTIFFIFSLCITGFSTESNIGKYISFKKSEIGFVFQQRPIAAISIIMPIFNKYKYLNRSFNSVESQTLQNHELVVIDDCSNDQSQEFVLQRMKADNRIKFIQHSYNQGTCNSRIHGAMSCTGEYIMSLDPDDLFQINTTEISYRMAVNLHADVIDIMVEMRHKNRIFHNWIPCKRNFSQNEHIIKTLKNFGFHSIPWNIWRKVVKNNIYQKAVQLMLPFVENKHINIGEDLIHCGCIFLYSNNFYCTFFIGYIYNYGIPGNSHTNTYQSDAQNQQQKDFGISLVRYFIKNRKKINKIGLNVFLDSYYNHDLYKNLTNVVKLPNMTRCEINIDGFTNTYFDKFGYCLIRKSN